MRTKPNNYLESARIKIGSMASDASFGNNGAFRIWRSGVEIHIIASDQDGWEHVSVSCENRCPTWEEMDYVKNLFWYETETVMQLHVPKTEHINRHNYCLHLWRPINKTIPKPPAIMV